MRLFFLGLLLISTFGLGLWAYKINYETRSAHQRVQILKKSIESSKKEIKILNAEWSHLNTPLRLRKLAEYYFQELRLTPINPNDFISYSKIYKLDNNLPTAELVDRTFTVDGNNE